jgi:hypothetical protein
LIGKLFLNVNSWNVGFTTPLVLIIYNVFWLRVFY